MTCEQQESIAGILDKVIEAGEGDNVSFGDVLNAFGQRVFGPMLMVPAFIAVAPTGAIPGMSVLTGSIIVLIAAQLLFRQGQPWLPERLKRASMAREKLLRSVETAEPYVRKVDAVTQPRLTWMITPPVQQMLAVICIAMALSMFPLALLPFAVAVPGVAVLLIGIALTTRDGYFAVAGSVIALVAIMMPPAWAMGWFG